jgi:predicted small lipoprotein YifL
VTRFLIIFVVAVALGTGLSTCGKKGNLQPPLDQKKEQRS